MKSEEIALVQQSFDRVAPLADLAAGLFSTYELLAAVMCQAASETAAA